MGLTAKSPIFDLFAPLRGAAMPVRALVAAGALFGIGENRIRVSRQAAQQPGAPVFGLCDLDEASDVLEGANIASGYAQVLSNATSPAA